MKAGSALLAGAALADPPNMDIVVAEVAAVGVGATLWKVDGPTTSAAEPKKDVDCCDWKPNEGSLMRTGPAGLKADPRDMVAGAAFGLATALGAKLGVALL